MKFGAKLNYLYSYLLEDAQVSEIVFEDNPDGKLNINTHCFAYSQLKKLVLPNTSLRLSLEFVHENPSLESVVFSYGDSISFGGDSQTVYMVECCFTQSCNLINKCANLKEVVSLNPLPPVIHESGRKMGPYFVHSRFAQRHLYRFGTIAKA